MVWGRSVRYRGEVLVGVSLRYGSVGFMFGAWGGGLHCGGGLLICRCQSTDQLRKF